MHLRCWQVLWNIDSPADERVGQAVLISHWEFEDGTRGGPGAPVDEGELEPAGRGIGSCACSTATCLKSIMRGWFAAYCTVDKDRVISGYGHMGSLRCRGGSGPTSEGGQGAQGGQGACKRR